MFSINQFKGMNNRSKGFMKPSKFNMVFPPPLALLNQKDRTFIANTSRYLQYKIDAIVMPGVDFSLHQVRRFGYGPVETKPWAPMFNDCVVSILCGGLGEEFTFFRRWLNLVLNFHNAYNIGVDYGNNDDTFDIGGMSHDVYEVAYKSDYMTDISVMIFRDDGQELIRTTLREAYPVSMSGLQYSWQDGNRIQKLNILFTFLDWHQTNLQPQLDQGATRSGLY